jgi:fido (protein-threonine AMPylation protein)
VKLGITKEFRDFVIRTNRSKVMCTIAEANSAIAGEQHTTIEHAATLQQAVLTGENRVKLNIMHVFSIHRRLFRYGGSFRRENALLTAASHPVTPSTKVRAEANQWVLHWADQLPKIAEQNTQARWRAVAEAHIGFEWIHPFKDGNGRVGRILLNYMTAYLDLPLVKIHPAVRNEYIAALDAADPDRLARLLVTCCL